MSALHKQHLTCFKNECMFATKDDNSLQHVQAVFGSHSCLICTPSNVGSAEFIQSHKLACQREQIKSISLRVQHTEHMTYMDSSSLRHCVNGTRCRTSFLSLFVSGTVFPKGLKDLVLWPYGALTKDCGPAVLMCQ